MADYDWVLWDTAPFGVAALTEHVLFQVAQGADATHTEGFTNSRGAGVLPQEESFAIEKIGVTLDYAYTTPADVKSVFRGSFVEIRVADRTVFKAPLLALSYRNDLPGHFTQAVAADAAAIGPKGDGYNLSQPIVIPGGTAFRVRVLQGTAVAGANSNIRVMLMGKLSMP